LTHDITAPVILRRQP